MTPGPVVRHFRANSEVAVTSTEAWLGTYLADWSRPDDWLMLAYDIVGVPEGRQAAPAVYVRPSTRLSSGGAAFNPDRLAEMLGSILGGSGDGHEHRALTRAIAALPPTAIAVFAAAAPEREPRFVRLVVAEVAASQVEAFLDRLEWPGSMPMVLRLLSEIQDVSECFMIAFDINEDGALPRLGFEMYPMTAVGADYQALLTTWLTTTSADWRGLTGRLVDMALCLPEKAEGLLS